MSAINKPEGGPNPVRLTPRQLEILGLVAGGLSNTEVAARLGITPGTVKAHLTMIYNKLGLKNRVQATRYYLEQVDPQKEQ